MITWVFQQNLKLIPVNSRGFFSRGLTVEKSLSAFNLLLLTICDFGRRFRERVGASVLAIHSGCRCARSALEVKLPGLDPQLATATAAL